jgi:two-component sensor histidine kinase
MPEPDRTKHDSYVETFLRTGKAKIIGRGREVEGRRKDGSVFPIDLSVVEWHLAEKRYFTGIMRDVTERKKREQQVDHLLREVNHRAKNMLALVQAVAMQTVATEPTDFVERFADRIQGLAASQDLLVRSQWQGIQLQELVRSQLAHFIDLIDLRITLKGPVLRISASSAQTIGMSLHELATNAGKYGALSNATGKVAIIWEFGHDAAEGDRFRLTWTENGGPVVKTPSRSGFGTKVIAAMPRASLGADVVLEYPAEGVRWSLDCPANNVIDSGGSHWSVEPVRK